MPDSPYTRAAVEAMARAVDAEHDFAGWLASVLARTAAHAGSADALTAGRSGSWEASLVEQLVKGTVGYGDDEHLPDSDGLHDHARPDLADHQAVLAVARAVLAADPDAAHRAAGTGSCEACTVIAALQLGFTLVAQFTGERMFVSEPLRLQLAAVIDATQAELDSSANLAGAGHSRSGVGEDSPRPARSGLR